MLRPLIGIALAAALASALVGAAAAPAGAESVPSPSPAAQSPTTQSPTTQSPTTQSPSSAPDPSTAAPGPVLTAPAEVRVTGRARDGAELVVRPGELTWGAQPEAVQVQWVRDGADVPGATGERLRLTAADVGHTVAVRVTAVLAGTTAAVTAKARTVQPGVTAERKLRDRLTALVRTLPGQYTVQVDELDGGRRQVGIGAARQREPASTAKVFIAYGVYTRIDRGDLSLDTRLASGLTVRACLRSMIEPSDNYCAIDLRQRIGTAWLTRLLHAEGFGGTTFWYAGGRTKTTTAADVNRLLARLAEGDLLSERSTKRFLGQLETHVWREAIPPGLPAGVRQASKPGTIWTSTGMVQTDTAIVWGPRSRYVLTVLGSDGATIGSIIRISRLVYRQLQGEPGPEYRYDRQQMKATGPLTLSASVSRGSSVLGRFGSDTKVEVIDSVRTRYLVRIGGRTGWVDNTNLALR